MVAAETLDPSLLSAMQAVTETLHFIGTHTEYIEEVDERAALIYAIGPTLAYRYSEHTRDLLELIEFVTAFPDDVRDLAQSVEDLLGRVVELMREILAEETPMNSDLWKGVETQYVTAMTLRNSFNIWRRAIEASRRAETAAAAAAESAGETAEHSLASEFESLGNREVAAANWFRKFTIGLFVATIGFTAYVAYGHTDRPAVEVGQKLALGIPALLLAGYLGRESGQHRRTARWASVLVAQLKSIRAYGVELPEASRAELKLDFGRRVFLESPETAATSDTSGESGPTPDVAAILREATDLARASRGAS
jgi:hypothetical protein